MSVRIDTGGATLLPYCTDCPWRGHPTLSRSAAHAQAVAHERRAHPGQKQAQSASGVYHSRRRPEM